MRITQGLPNLKLDTQQTPASKGDFSEFLKNGITDVNDKLKNADRASELLINGEIDFHNAMIIAEKANLALELTMAIRNKVVESYQEIMRMQV